MPLVEMISFLYQDSASPRLSFTPPTPSQLSDHDLVSCYSEDTEAMKLIPIHAVIIKFADMPQPVPSDSFKENVQQKNDQWSVLLGVGIYSLLCSQET